MDIVKVLAEWHAMHQQVDIDDDRQCWAGTVECGICGHIWFGAEMIEDDQIEPIIPLECPECGHAAGHPE